MDAPVRRLDGSYRNHILALLDRARAAFPEESLLRVSDWLGQLVRNGSFPPSQHPWQEPWLNFPGLTARPWHDPAQQRDCQMLEAAASQILEEIGEMLSRDGVLSPYRQDKANFILGDSWQQATLLRWRVPDPDLAPLFPRTTAVVQQLPSLSHLATVSVLRPGGVILPHCGPTNLRLTAHLGISIPPNCWMRVGDERRTWQPGRCLLFDDSFEHEVANTSESARAVLLVDLWHPDLTDTEVAVMKPLLALLNNAYKSLPAENFAADTIGWGP